MLYQFTDKSQPRPPGFHFSPALERRYLFLGLIACKCLLIIYCVHNPSWAGKVKSQLLDSSPI